jgi:uncharacterized membrane protein YeaQ/YmgE (transglycosylase-associated protein family)
MERQRRTEVTILAPIIGIVSAIVCSFIAKEKGRSRLTWALLGFFTGVIGLAILVVLPPVSENRESQRIIGVPLAILHSASHDDQRSSQRAKTSFVGQRIDDRSGRILNQVEFEEETQYTLVNEATIEENTYAVVKVAGCTYLVGVDDELADWLEKGRSDA